MSAINVNSITGRTGTHGPVLTGVTTVTGGTLNTGDLNVTGAASFSGNVSIAGTLTYDDVTSIDSVGIITAKSGIHVTGGNVGIGLTNPSEKLHTIGDVMIQGTGGVGEQTLFIGKSATVIPSTRGVAVAADQNFSADHDMVLKTSTNSSGLVEQVRITNAGYVGVGTDGPGSLVDIASGDLEFSNKANSSAIQTINFSDGTQGRGKIRYLHDGDNLTFHTFSDERLRIDSSGLIANNGRVPSSYGSPNLLISGTDSTLTLMGDGSTNVSSFTGIKFRVAGLSAGDYSKAGIFVQRQASYNDLDMIFAFRSTADAAGVAISDEKLRITSDGLVGVGTGTPTQILELRTGEPRLCLNGTIAGSDKGIEFEHNGTRQGHLFHNPTSGEMSLSVGENTGGAHYLAFKAGNGTEKMRIASDGQLRINHTTNIAPDGYESKLQTCDTSFKGSSVTVRRDEASANGPAFLFVKTRGTSKGANDVIADGDQCGLIKFYVGDGSDSNSSVGGIEAFVDNTPGANDTPGRLVFKTTTDGQSVGTERMRIDSKGRVLISGGTITAGTVQPGTVWSKGNDNLIISEGTGSGYTEGAFKAVSPADYRGGGIFMYNANSGGTSNQWFAGRPYAGSDQYIIARNTGVTVNEQSTAQTTHQLLTVYSSGNATLQGTLTQSGSDDKLKKNRIPLASALDKVKTLEGFTFNWNEDAINNYGFRSDEGLLVGMSAQELQAVLPEAVKTVTKNKEVSDPTSGEEGEKIEYLTIQYDRVVPLLVEAIKELSDKVSALEGS